MSLSYTTGNPNNLTGGTTAAMNDIQGPFTDIKTFLTDGSGAVGDTILASPNNAVWRSLFSISGFVTASSVATSTTYYFQTNNGAPSASGVAAISPVAGLWTPTASGDVAVSGKTTRLRLRVTVAVNATTPAANFVWGLYPITALAGGASNVTPTLGTVTGTVTSSGPSGGSAQTTAGTSFDLSTLSTSTVYCPGLTISANLTAASALTFQLFLEMRHT